MLSDDKPELATGGEVNVPQHNPRLSALVFLQRNFSLSALVTIPQLSGVKKRVKRPDKT